MNTKHAFALITLLAVAATTACKTPRQVCYEENRCDSASAECVGMMGMLTGLITASSQAHDTASNGTLSGAASLTTTGTNTITGTLSTSSDNYDVYYAFSDSSAMTVSASMTVTAGTPTCTMYTTYFSSSNTNPDPKSVADSNFNLVGALSAAPTTVQPGWGYYIYIVCQAGTAGDAYTLTFSPANSGSDMSALTMMMCTGSSASCRSSCNSKYAY